MFSVKVEVTEKAKETLARAASSSDALFDETSNDSIEFSVGNHKVEHVTGIIHLYKKTNHNEESMVSNQVCVICVPSDVGVQEFCHFCGPFLKHIKQMRFLRKENTRQTVYMVYLKFEDTTSAKEFVEERNGQPFCSFERELVWKLVFVDHLEFSVDPKPSAGETELPTCPVCLERLDESTSGLVITVCSHIFHNECLMKWGDTSCPVCRHCMQATSKSSCPNCGASEDLWICLICGHIGCGRYKSKHAIDHWKETQHCYALELESQRVWDYVGDGYVHRLVQSKTDGKLVEVSAPGECSRNNDARLPSNSEYKVDYDRDEAIVASKIDAVAFEYNHLLTAQLESQRLYFEGVLFQNRLEAEAKMKSLSDRVGEMTEALESTNAELTEMQKQKKSSHRKISELTAKLKKAEEEKTFLRELNDSLVSDQVKWRARTNELESRLEKTTAEKDARIQELEEQSRDLIFNIEAQKTVTESADLQGGSLLSQPTTAISNRRRRSKK